jgi:hypothetical protein
MASKLLELNGEIRPVLTEYARGTKNPSHVLEEILPVAYVGKELVNVPTFGEEEFQEEDTERAVDADSNVADIENATELPIQLVEHDLEAKVDYRKKKAAFYNYERRAQVITTRKVALKVELERARELSNTTHYADGHSDTLTGENKWSNKENSDPVNYIKDKKMDVSSVIGVAPNVMLISEPIYKALTSHPGVIELIKYSQKGIITLELLQEVFEIEKILVSRSMYRPKGAAKASAKQRIWGNDCLLAYVYNGKSSIDSGDLMPSLGYTFRLDDTELGKMPFVFSYKPGNGKITYINTTDILLPKIVMPSAGYLVKDCI